MSAMRAFRPNLMKPVAIVCFSGYCVWNCYFLMLGVVPDSILHAATGLPCPTTGGVRSMVAYLHGDFAQGFLYNPFAPVFIVLFCVSVSLLAHKAYHKKPLVISSLLTYAWALSLVSAWLSKFAIGPYYW
jgi:hypothetical protein